MNSKALLLTLACSTWAAGAAAAEKFPVPDYMHGVAKVHGVVGAKAAGK